MQHAEPPIVVEAERAANATVLWLHGLGADANDFLPVVSQFDASTRDRTRFIFPNAPIRPISINGGMQMRAWYDIVDASLERRVDEEGVRQSSAYLSALVDQECDRGIVAARIVLAGFSQGGAIALHTGLRYPQRLAGILALSTYLPLAERLSAERSPANHGVNIFLGHGSQDPLIPLALSEQTSRHLGRLGQSVEAHTYPMEHAVCPEEIRDIANWLERMLG